MSILYFIPSETELTSMEVFKKAIIDNKSLQRAYLDDLNDIYVRDAKTFQINDVRQQDWEWHNAFEQYHELLLDFNEVAVGLVSNGFWIDDISFMPVNDFTAIKLILR